MVPDIIAREAVLLGQLDTWLEKGIAHAQARKVEPAVLLDLRLAVDQFPLYRQVQSACDAAKFSAARMAGVEPPKHADERATLEELRARIADVRAFIAGIPEASYEGWEGRKVPLPFAPGMAMMGRNYLLELSLPNFMFHLAHCYAILRHSGVELGKQDFLGPITLIEL